MRRPRVLIVRAPGTNCDKETEFAFEQAGGAPVPVHINRLLENPNLLLEFEILCIPGGFSYGDDIAAGRILANQIRHHLAETLGEFRDAGKLILGICNGFQVLMKSGMLLPASPDGQPIATLTDNDSGKFEDRWVHLAVSTANCVFLSDIESMYLPIAHAEGKFVGRDAQTIEQLERDGQLALRYTTGNGNGEVDYPANPNGSMQNVAAVCDQSGRVFGLMPHPERHIDPTQHPRWTRGEGQHIGDGLKVFENAVEYFAAW